MTATMKDDAMPDGPVPRALVVTAPGINCDGELARAFHEAGAEPEPVLFSRLSRDPSIVDGFDLTLVLSYWTF